MAAIYEIDHNGIRIYGTNKGLSFYSADRTLRQEIYLKDDNTLNIGGGGSATSLPTETSANGLYVRLDGKNWASWTPDSGTQSIVGSFNLAGAAYEYKIGGAHALSLDVANDVLLVGPHQGSYDISTIVAGSAVVVGSYIAPGTVVPDLTNSVIVGTYIGLVDTLELYDAVVIGDTIFADAAAYVNESVIIGSGTLANATHSEYDVIINAVFSGAYEGSNNVIIGAGAADDATTAQLNVIAGRDAASNLTTGVGNVISGADSAAALTTGSYNTILGGGAGMALTTADSCVFHGSGAGYYETGSNKLFIDNASRASEADARVKALVYGVFDAATANQYFTINGHLSVLETGTFANEGLHLLDTNASHDLILKPGSDLDADYIFTITTGNGARTLDLGGNFTIDATTSITGGGMLDLATFTLTVPATGTAALLGVANVLTETNTFPGVQHAPQVTPSGDTGHVAYDSTKDRLVLQHEHHDFPVPVDPRNTCVNTSLPMLYGTIVQALTWAAAQTFSGGFTAAAASEFAASLVAALVTMNQSGTGDILDLQDGGTSVVRVPDQGGMVLVPQSGGFQAIAGLLGYDDDKDRLVLRHEHHDFPVPVDLRNTFPNYIYPIEYA